MLKRYCILIFLLSFLACSNDESCDGDQDYTNAKLELDFEDLTHQIKSINDTAELTRFFETHPIVKDEFFEFGGRPTKQQVLNDISRLVQSPKVKSLFQAKSLKEFEGILEKDRGLREFLTYDYLSTNKGKSVTDVYELFTQSSITQLSSLEAASFKPLESYLDSNPKEEEYFYTTFAYRSDEDLLTDNLKLLKNDFVDTLYQETINLINTGRLAYDLDRAYKKVRGHYPDFTPPKVQAVYSGFGKDIHFSDSLLVIGLDYYLGEKASFRPNVYEYIRVRLTPEHLVPQLLQFTSLKFNETNKGKRNILEEMIYYGKAMEFISEMLPCIADSTIMGYSSQQFANASVSEAVIWSHFLENELLYNDNPSSITKYIDERPAVPEIDKRCPGRIGQWLGWQIVKAYRKETEVDFIELMNETDAQKILTQSKYRPRLR